MSIATLFGTRIATSLGALAIAGSLAGGTAVAANSGAEARTEAKDNPVRDIRHELRDATKAEREEIKDIRRQLADEYAKDAPDAERMEALHDAIEAKKAALADKRFEALMDMHDELDAKQREKVAERLAKGKPHKGKKDKANKGKAKGKDKAAKAERGERKGKDKAERGERGRKEAKRSTRAGNGKAKGKDKRPA